MKKLLTVLLLLCLGMACNTRHVSKTNDKTDVHIESFVTKADSVHVKTEATKEVITYYGDTLKGSIQLNDVVTKDSIESDGIKVVVQSTKNLGTTSLRLTAIAKPTKVVDRSRIKQDIIQHQSGTQNILKDSTATVQRKEVKSEPKGFT